jgi:cobalt-zinc-cadmium efflux system protein
MHDHATGHHHGHAHAHGAVDHGRAFALGIGLNVAFIAAEVAGGLWADSLALLADAGHNASDVLSLVLAWAALAMARRPPTRKRTYGLGRGTILASLLNALVLLVAVGAMAWEAIQRLFAPVPVASLTVIVVAGIGVLVNGFTAWLFVGGAKGDVNIRGAYLHMAADAGISMGVVLAAMVIALTGWLWLDPGVTLLICAAIVWGTWGLLKESFDLAMDSVPSGIDQAEVEAWLAARPGVAAVHDLHIWPLSSTEVALTAHLVRPAGTDDRFLFETTQGLAEHFGIGHSTLQLERGEPGTACALEPAHVV